MIVKQHLTPKNELVLAICDSNLVGKKFEDEDFQIDCSSDFYKGKEMTEDETKELISHCVSANVVGEDSIKFIKTLGFLSDSSVKTIAGIPHTQAFRISD